jgi:hypothetical protein
MANYLLIETGDNLLLEDGVSLFLLETDTAEGEVAVTSTLRFDSWEFGVSEPNTADRDDINYYIAFQMLDNGVENQDKAIDAIRVTAQTSDNGKVQIHGFEQGDDIVRSDIDDGLNARYEINITDATTVTRHKRVKGGPKNMALWCPRFSGTWTGLTDEPDRLDEMVIEVRVVGTKK